MGNGAKLGAVGNGGPRVGCNGVAEMVSVRCENRSVMGCGSNCMVEVEWMGSWFVAQGGAQGLNIANKGGFMTCGVKRQKDNSKGMLARRHSRRLNMQTGLFGEASCFGSDLHQLVQTEH